MGFFAKLKDAKPLGQNRDPQAKPGKYLIRIDGIKKQTSQKPPHGEFVAFEYTIVHVLDDNNGLAHKIGHEASELAMSYGAGAQVYVNKVAGFLVGCLNQQPDEEDADAAMSEKQPLKGLVVEMTAISKPYTHKVKKTTEIAVNRNYSRSISKAEAESILTSDEIAKFFKNGIPENPYVTA